MQYMNGYQSAHPPSSAFATRSFSVIIESKQIAMLVNTYNIHFSQYSNERKKKLIQIILYATIYILYEEEIVCHLYACLSW